MQTNASHHSVTAASLDVWDEGILPVFVGQPTVRLGVGSFLAFDTPADFVAWYRRLGELAANTPEIAPLLDESVAA